MKNLISDKELFVSLNTLEKMRLEIMNKIVEVRIQSEINDKQYSNKAISDTKRKALNTLGNYRKLTFEDTKNSFDVHQFSYYGALPPYKDGYYQEFENYYHTLTFSQYQNLQTVNQIKGKALLVIAHYYNNNTQTDLDNRNRKYLIDMLRSTNLLHNDTWQFLSIYEEGFKDTTSHVQLYLLDSANKNSFFTHFTNHHDELKFIPIISNYEQSEIVNFKPFNELLASNIDNQSIEIKLPPVEDVKLTVKYGEQNNNKNGTV